MLKKKKISATLGFMSLVAAAAGVAFVATSCSTNNITSNGNNDSNDNNANNNSSSDIIDYPTNASPNDTNIKLINLGDYLPSIEKTFAIFNNAQRRDYVPGYINEFLDKVNQLFPVYKDGFDVILNVRWTNTNNNGFNSFSKLTLVLNNTFAYRLNVNDQQKVTYNFAERTLTFKNPISTKIPDVNVNNPDIKNFDANTDNYYGVFLSATNDGFYNGEPITLETIAPVKVPKGFSNSDTKKTYSLYYANDLDATSFKNYQLVQKARIGVKGELSGDFSLGKKIQFSNITKPGIYLVNYNFKNSSKEVNLLCGYKIIDATKDTSIGSFTTNRALDATFLNTGTTLFSTSKLQLNGVDITKKENVVMKKDGYWDLSTAANGEYNTTVFINDTNPLTTQYSFQRSYLITTTVNNPLNNVSLDITDFDYVSNTAKLSLTKPTANNQPGTPPQNGDVNFYSQPEARLSDLIDSVTTNSGLAKVGLYVDNNVKDNKFKWQEITDLANNDLIENPTNINKTLKNIQPVNVVVGPGNDDNGKAFSLTVATGNGYRFNTRDTKYFSTYTTALDDSIQIASDGTEITLPTKDIHYTVISGTTVEGIDEDTPHVDAPVVGIDIKLGATFTNQADALDTTWQYKDTDGVWKYFPQDCVIGTSTAEPTPPAVPEETPEVSPEAPTVPEGAPETSTGGNSRATSQTPPTTSTTYSSYVSIPAKYNNSMKQFAIRAVSKTSQWMPTHYKTYMPKTTPKAMFRMMQNNDTQIRDINRAYNDKFSKMSLVALPLGCTTVRDGSGNDGAFTTATSVKNWYIPNWYTTIGSFTWQNNNKIESIDLNNSNLGKVPYCAFENCSNLKTVKMENSPITIVDQYSFKNTPKLENFVAPATLKSILREGFRNSGSSTFWVDISKTKSVFIDTFAFNGSNVNEFYGTENIDCVKNNTFENCRNFNPNGNGALIFSSKFIWIETNSFSLNSPHVKYLAFTADRYKDGADTLRQLDANNWVANVPNLYTIFFKNEAIEQLWNDQGKTRMGTLDSHNFGEMFTKKEISYNNYIVYQRENAPELPPPPIVPEEPEAPQEPPQEVTVAFDNETTSSATTHESINLNISVPTSLPKEFENLKTNNYLLNYSLYFSPLVDEQNMNNFKKVVETVKNPATEIAKSDIGIASEIAGPTALGSTINITGAKAQGTYRVCIGYDIKTSNATILTTKYKDIVLTVVDNASETPEGDGSPAPEPVEPPATTEPGTTER